MLSVTVAEIPSIYEVYLGVIKDSNCPDVFV
jgi:hypothetical protein